MENPSQNARIRRWESPRECYFCLDVAYQAEFKRLWLEGADPLDIRKEWTRRKSAQEAAARVETESQDEPEPPAERWDGPAFEGSRPTY